MNRKLHHPWWTHLPALACVVWSGVLLATANAPARVPVHFGIDGRADRFGSIVELWIAFVAIPLLFVLGGVVADEAYARCEDRRRFNWLAPIDEALAGFFLGMTLLTIPLLSAKEPVLDGILRMGLPTAAAAVLAAAVLEWLRPHRPRERPARTPLASPPAEMTAQMADPSSRWMHWEVQNPLYLRLLVPGTVLILLVAGVASFPHAPWTLAITLPAIILLATCCGGMHVSVNRQRVLVRLGAIGIPLLRIKVEDLQAVEAVDFNPLGDFGGWGIRYSLGKRMWGFFFYGTRGVVVTTRKGKRYLIGSDTPETLAEICESARKSQSQGKPT